MSNKKEKKKSNGLLKGLKYSVALPILVVLMIIVLLASFVYAIFHGIIEIMETVLGEILDFLSDPISWLQELSRHAHNLWVTAFRWARCQL